MGRALMILGTASKVGKSAVAAGLCRIFHHCGISVAPFKAQNLSLNSFVTSEGGEMSWAQAAQAEACKIRPHVDMNPVLVKPTAGTGSHVIVQGRVFKNVRARLSLPTQKH
jgi:adenosylcobyric acid synthase